MQWFRKKRAIDALGVKGCYKQPNIHRFRRLVQWISLFLLNPYIILGGLGIMSLAVYKERIQNMQIVFPVMNCYASPAAAAACPIGAMGQLIAAGVVPFFVIGVFFVVGAIAGRFFCGWICPFGLIQELFYKIPSKKFKLPNFTSYFKYFFLVITVILIPAVWGTSSGTGTPSEVFFCNICPAAALEATIPTQIQLAIEGNLSWHLFFTHLLVQFKFWLLIFFVLLFIITKRPFCKTMCPSGAIYGLFNTVSLLRMKVDTQACANCNRCNLRCPIDHAIKVSSNSPECIRCFECEFEACDFNAISSNISRLRKLETKTVSAAKTGGANNDGEKDD